MSPTPAERVLFREVLTEMGRRGIPVDAEAVAEARGPQDDDELHEAIRVLTGYDIPRAAVCEGHVAPFTVLADLYFERRSDVLCIGNRGGGKTTLSGFLHGAKCRWLPGYKTAIAGAVEKQGQRAYAEFKRFIRHLSEEVVDTMLSRTLFANGSELEVLGGTVKQLNGPHPHLAQMDEVELTTPEPFEEFQNMAQGDSSYAGQQLLTSTRKRAYGMVQRIVAECEEAVKADAHPPWDVQIFCVFETMEHVPDCGSTCGCERIVKGYWDDGTPRTFASVCNGRGLRSRGFVRRQDVQKRFRQLSRMTWEAQQECLRPNIEGVVHSWVHERHRLERWMPRPEYGAVYRSWDWGGENPHSVHFAQLLDVPVTIDGHELQEGQLVTFDEIFYSGGGFYNLGLRVLARTQEWAEFGYPFKVELDACDPAGASAKADVRKAFEDSGQEPPRWTSIPAQVDVSVQKHIEWGEDDRLYYVPRMCPNLDDEYGTYHWPDEKPGSNRKEAPVKEDDHAVDDQRYLVWNLYKRGLMKTSGETPGSTFDREREGLEPGPLPSTEESDVAYRSRRHITHEPVASTARPEYVSGLPGSTRVRTHSVPGVRRQAP